MSHTEPAWPAGLLGDPHTAPDKAERVRRMFNGIAPRYELINTLFSAGRDAYWRRRAVELGGVRGDDQVLDVACGTGDFARAFAAAGARTVVGCDFAHEMLTHAVRRHFSGTLRRSNVVASIRPAATVLKWCEADALRLPFREGSFSIVSCAFGVRNFEDLDAGLAQMFRVLRPSGRAVILEFARPWHPLARTAYEFYAHRVMPWAASLISGDRSNAYRYLPRSVVSFLDGPQMCARLRQAGFAGATATPLTLGIVNVYVAARS